MQQADGFMLAKMSLKKERLWQLYLNSRVNSSVFRQEVDIEYSSSILLKASENSLTVEGLNKRQKRVGALGLGLREKKLSNRTGMWSEKEQ